MENIAFSTYKLFIEIFGTNVDDDLLYLLPIQILESRLNVIALNNEKFQELKSAYEQREHPIKLDSLFVKIRDCLIKMKSATENVLKFKRNHGKEKKSNRTVEMDFEDADSCRNDENPKNCQKKKSNFIEIEDFTIYKYAHRLSQSLSSQSLVNSVSSGSFTSKQDRIDDGYIDQTPEPITYSLGGDETNENINKSSKYSSENSLSRISTKVLPPNFLNFDDLYHGEEEFYISKEWRQWFSFNAEADGFRFNNYDKVLEYLKQSQNDNLDDFHFSLHEIFSDVNPWILDEKLNQIKNLSINSKKDLHLLVECIYYKCLATRDINGHFDTMTTLCCELFDEIGIFDETISNVVMFGELLSAKCRQSFFIQDISVAHHYLRNVKLISKLCKTNTFDRRIIIVCLYFLCQSQKQAHLEAFFQILKQWFGIPSLFELADSSVKNKNAINFVFDELENFISTIEKQRKEFFDTKDAKNSSIEFDDQTPRSPDTPEISKYTFEQLKKSLEDYDHIFNNRK